MKPQWSSYPSLIFAGLALGWMVGLSLSPILQIIVTAVVGLVVAMTAALAGMEINDTAGTGEQPHIRPRRKLAHVSALPVGLLTVSLAIGSGFGVYARTNEWFGIQPKRSASRWIDAGLSPKEVVQRLFDNVYSPPTGKGGDEKKSPAPDPAANVSSHQGHIGSLFAVSASECKIFLSRSGEQLRLAMLADNNESIQKLAQTVKSTDDLKAFVTELCSQPQ